jgi:hypothetical protein
MMLSVFSVALSIFLFVLHLQKYYFLSESGWFGLFLFLCSLKQLKQNRYEQNFEGNGSPNVDDGFCGGMRQAAGGTSKTSSRGGC